MLDTIRKVALVVSLLVIGGGLAFYFYTATGGGSDWADGSLEPVRFATLQHDPSDKAYLICSNVACGSTEADRESLFLEAPLTSVRRALTDLVDREARYQMLSFDVAGNQFEIGERIPGKPFFGIVSVLLLPYGENRTEVVVYAYQPVGSHSKGDNVSRANEVLDAVALMSGT